MAQRNREKTETERAVSVCTQTDKVSEDVTAGCENLKPEAQKMLQEHTAVLENQTFFHEKLKKYLANSHQEMEVLRIKADNAEHLNNILMREISGLKDRLSEIASKKMSDGNPCVEDLSDPNRPTALQQEWEAFFCGGHFWTLFDALVKSGSSEDQVACIVYEVCWMTNATCCNFMQEIDSCVARTLAEKLDDSSPQNRSATSQEEQTTAEKLRKALIPFLPQDAPGRLLEMCVRNVAQHFKGNERVSKFAEDFARLCYRLRRQEIPLFVDFSHQSGSQFKETLFTLEDKVKRPPPDGIIAFIIRPPLLRYEGGPVLCKGEAVLRSTSQPTKRGENDEVRRPKSQQQSSNGGKGSQTHDSPAPGGKQRR